MNGYGIIAAAIISHNAQVIMGEAYRGGIDSDDFRKVYVVATADHPDNAPDSWHHGTYFDGPDSRESERRAKARFAAELISYWGVTALSS